MLGYWAHPDGEAAVRAAATANVPAVVMVGGSDVLLLTGDSARRRCILGVLSSADAVLTVGHDLRERLLGMGLPAPRIHAFSRGVDESVFHPGDKAEARARLGVAPDVRLFLWVGRMVPVKGLDVLLAACAILHRKGAAFRLALVGDGPLRRSLEEQAATLGLGDTVMFAGSVAHGRLGDWYRAADLTVLPSRSEGVPNVLLESLACGTPFVASRVGGVPALAPDPRALVPPGDAAPSRTRCSAASRPRATTTARRRHGSAWRNRQKPWPPSCAAPSKNADGPARRPLGRRVRHDQHSPPKRGAPAPHAPVAARLPRDSPATPRGEGAHRRVAGRRRPLRAALEGRGRGARRGSRVAPGDDAGRRSPGATRTRTVVRPVYTFFYPQEEYGRSCSSRSRR